MTNCHVLTNRYWSMTYHLFTSEWVTTEICISITNKVVSTLCVSANKKNRKLRCSDHQVRCIRKCLRVALCLCFKTSPSAKPFLWKWLWVAWSWTCMQNSFSYERFSQLDSFWHRGKWPIITHPPEDHFFFVFFVFFCSICKNSPRELSLWMKRWIELTLPE